MPPPPSLVPQCRRPCNGYRGEFRILLNIYDGASVFLYTMINLTNVMKVFVFSGVFIAKKGCFYRYFHIPQCNKLTNFFNPSISSQMSLIVIFVDNSDIAGGKQRGRLASNNHC